MQGEKIYTKIVMDMTQDELPVLEEDYFYYNGPMSYCQGDDDPDFEDDTNNDPNNDPSAGGEPKDDKASKDIEEVKSILQQVVQATKGNAEAIKEIRELQANHQTPSKDPDKTEDDNEPAPQNIEMMSRQEYAEYIKKQALKEFQKEIGGLKEEVNYNRQETQEERLRREANELRNSEVGKGKDLDEWRDEIKELYKRTQGTLTMKQLYNLARSENPDKAKEVDKKYKPKETDTKTKEPVDDTFGGLVPSSSKIEEAKKKGKLSSEQAGEEAWRIMFGDSDDI
jgi:hypothetical protein